jgi:hypothetical protein
MDLTEKWLLENVEKKLGCPPNVKTIYHYTTVEALVNGIIREDAEKGKEICFRATHINYLNDYEEFSVASLAFATKLSTSLRTETLEGWKKEIQKSWGDIFVLSFSRDKDSLPMWNTYANRGTGIALGIQKPQSTSETSVVLQCMYDKLPKDINNFPPTTFHLYHLYLPLLIKNRHYRYEKEVRYVGNFKDSKIKFRERNGIVIPYKEVYFPKEQLESVMIAPSLEQTLATDAIRKFLDNRGFEHVRIKTSTIPYRNL